MSNLEKREAALAAADHLAHSLDENTRALRRVNRRQLWLAGFIVALALTLGLAMKFNYDGNVSRCQSGNDLREEIDAKFQSMADILEDAGIGDDPEGAKLLVVLSTDLPKRDCSEINWLGR